MNKTDEVLHCPDCHDQGWYMHRNPWTDKTELVECKWCHEEPRSVYNANQLEKDH